MIRYLSIAVGALGTLAALAGCVGDESDTPSDTEIALSNLESVGFDRNEAVVNGDNVTVDDVVFSKQGLIDGEYEPAEENSHGASKGYRWGSLVSAANAGKIKLAFATGSAAPSAAMVTAVKAAANQWSSVALNTIRISTTNTGPAITVGMSSAWPGTTGCGSGTVACARYPQNGAAGVQLWFRLIPDGCGWSSARLLNVALHELGHAIGFVHPKALSSSGGAAPIHISGTMSCGQPDEASCAANLNYATVMDGGPTHFQTGTCNITDPTSLTPDDKASIATVY